MFNSAFSKKNIVILVFHIFLDNYFLKFFFLFLKRHIAELIFYMEELRAHVRKYGPVMQRYYVQYLSGFDAVVLNELVQVKSLSFSFLFLPFFLVIDLFAQQAFIKYNLIPCGGDTDLNKSWSYFVKGVISCQRGPAGRQHLVVVQCDRHYVYVCTKLKVNTMQGMILYFAYRGVQ